MPGQPATDDGGQALTQLLESLLGLPTRLRPFSPESTTDVPPAPVEPAVEPPPTSLASKINAHPDGRAAVDVLARHGLTTTEAEAVIGELTDAAVAGGIDLKSFASNYATLQSIGSSDPAVRSVAAAAVAKDFRALQEQDGRMTLAELSLLGRSPDYAQLSGRGAAWFDDDSVAIGDAVVTAEGEQLILETADGLLFAWRAGSGPSARYIVEDALTPDDLVVLQSSEGESSKAPAGAKGGASAPGEDPEEEPKRQKKRTWNYRALDRKTNEVTYVGITVDLPRRTLEWLRVRSRYYNEAIKNMEPTNPLRSSHRAGVDCDAWTF